LSFSDCLGLAALRESLNDIRVLQVFVNHVKAVSDCSHTAYILAMPEMVALLHAYRRLVWTSLAFPLVAVVFPVGFWMSIWLLRCCTDYGALTMLLWFAFSVYGFSWVRKLASTSITEHALEIALERNRVRLPLFMFAFACVVSNALGPMLRRNGLNLPDMTLPIGMGLGAAFRITLAMFVLEILVVLRFFGPWGISTLCSSFAFAADVDAPSELCLRCTFVTHSETLNLPFGHKSVCRGYSTSVVQSRVLSVPSS
jgi:hypothetical protein